jgi:hypothetical protein
MIDSSYEQFFTDNRAQYGKHTPNKTEFPIDTEGQDAKTETTENPEAQQTSSLSDIPFGARFHSSSSTNLQCLTVLANRGPAPYREDLKKLTNCTASLERQTSSCLGLYGGVQ